MTKRRGALAALASWVLALVWGGPVGAQQEGEAPPLAAFAFMTGSWCSAAPPGATRLEEQWGRADADVMLGTTRFVRDGAVVDHEFGLLEARGGGEVVLTPHPRGQRPVPFRLTESAPGRAVFENPDHDFPARIEYEAVGGSLTVRALGADGEGPSWPMTPCDPVVSIALRVHRLEAVRAFYEDAFGARFRPVDTGGVPSWFGRVGGVTLKLVPIRDGVDFESFPIHQPGFVVDDVAAVVERAVASGGRLEGEPVVVDGVMVEAAIRDPDGNTLELVRRGR